MKVRSNNRQQWDATMAVGLCLICVIPTLVCITSALVCIIPTLIQVTPPSFRSSPPSFVSPCPCLCLLTLHVILPSFASPHSHSRLSTLVCVFLPLFVSPPTLLCVVRLPVCTVASSLFVISTAPAATATVAVSVSIAVAAAVCVLALTLNVPLVCVRPFCALLLFLLWYKYL